MMTNIKGYQNVLVHAEMHGEDLAPITRELLIIGRKLADGMGYQSVACLIIGSIAPGVAEKLFALGVDEIHQVNHPLLAEFHPDIYTQAVVKACQIVRPMVFLLGHTDLGSEIGPRVAARLGTNIFTSCIDIHAADNGKLPIYVRPVYGGKAIAEVVSSSCPQIATLRPKSTIAAPLDRSTDRSAEGKITTLAVELEDSLTGPKLVETMQEEHSGIKLEDARVIVCGGGGIGSADDFKVLRLLADVLGGVVGVTRVPCDEGWMHLSQEIGQTGKIVSPDLYIAIGVSGAPQHIAGCLGSKRIVAINRDPDAPIFRVSDFGIVGDYREILPILIEECKRASL